MAYYEIRKLFGEHGNMALGIWRQMMIYDPVITLDADGFEADDRGNADAILAVIADRVLARVLAIEED